MASVDPDKVSQYVSGGNSEFQGGAVTMCIVKFMAGLMIFLTCISAGNPGAALASVHLHAPAQLCPSDLPC
jgi:hypothetical protein